MDIDDSEENCICKGNWRNIVAECEPLLGKMFTDRNGNEYRFVGVMHGDDDYYYCMRNKTDTQMLSCVGDLDGWQFTLKEQS